MQLITFIVLSEHKLIGKILNRLGDTLRHWVDVHCALHQLDTNLTSVKCCHAVNAMRYSQSMPAWQRVERDVVISSLLTSSSLCT